MQLIIFYHGRKANWKFTMSFNERVPFTVCCSCTVMNNALAALLILWTVHFFNYTTIFVSLTTFWPMLCETVLLRLVAKPPFAQDAMDTLVKFILLVLFGLDRKKNKLRDLKQQQLHILLVRYVVGNDKQQLVAFVLLMSFSRMYIIQRNNHVMSLPAAYLVYLRQIETSDRLFPSSF